MSDEQPLLEELWEPDPAAEAERVTRRLAAVLRELERRSSDADRLQTERDLLAAECHDLRQRASQYDALMATKTMRLLAVPRQFYARLRQRTAR